MENIRHVHPKTSLRSKDVHNLSLTPYDVKKLNARVRFSNTGVDACLIAYWVFKRPKASILKKENIPSKGNDC